MGEEAKIRIRIRCEESFEQNRALMRLLSEIESNTLRSNLARCAIDLAQEHHAAIVGLVSYGCYGSAGALLSPLLESAACASWLMYVPSCERIKELASSEKDIPILGAMLHDLKPTFPEASKL